MESNDLLDIRRRMRVRVYHAEGDVGLINVSGFGESAFGVVLRRLFQSEIYSCSEKSAAVEAYLQSVAVYRQERLRDLNAPALIIDAETDRKKIGKRLKFSSLLPGFCYVLDNQVELWVITVDWDDESHDSDEAQQEAWSPDEVDDVP